MTHYRSLDKNHLEIVLALRRQGIHVTEFDRNGRGIPDVQTYARGKVVFIEIKHGKNAVLKKSQIEFLSQFPGYIGIARDSDEAFQLATEPEKYALTYAQKEKLKAFAYRLDAKEVRLATVEKEIAI